MSRDDGARGAFGAADDRILVRPGAEACAGPHRPGGRLVQHPAGPRGPGPHRQPLGEEPLRGPPLLLRAERGNYGATSGSSSSASAHLTRHIASAPFLDHDMPRPFILAAPTWALVPSMIPMDSFGNTTQSALLSMYPRRSRTLFRRALFLR